MRQEQQPQRSEKTDLRVHACLYFIRPTGHTYVPSKLQSFFFFLLQLRPVRNINLNPLDVEVMKRLGNRVNLIPIIAKADTLMQRDLQTFKKRVR